MLRVFNALCTRPITTINDICQRAGLTFPAATKGIERLVDLGIVKERTGGRRNRVFAYDRYLVLLNEGTEPLWKGTGIAMSKTRTECGRAQKNSGAAVGCEAQLWQMADALRGSVDAAEDPRKTKGVLAEVTGAGRPSVSV